LIEKNHDWESLRIIILIFKRLCLQTDEFPKKYLLLRMIDRLTKLKKQEVLSIIEKEFLFLLPTEYLENQRIFFYFEKAQYFNKNNKIYIKLREYLFFIEDFIFDGIKYFSEETFQTVYRFFISLELGVRERTGKIIFKENIYKSISQYSLIRTAEHSNKSEGD
jgi:hypothetical protein